MNFLGTQLIAVAAIAMAAGMPANTMTDTEVGRKSSANVLGREARDRDKSGTNMPLENTDGPQVAKNKLNASRGSFEAEGKGFDPIIESASRKSQRTADIEKVLAAPGSM